MPIPTQLQVQVDAIQSRIEALAPSATPEDVVMLAKAVEAIGAQATVFDVLVYGDQKKTELEALASQQQSGLTTLAHQKESSLTALATAKESSLSHLAAAKETGLTQLADSKAQTLAAFAESTLEDLTSLGAVDYGPLVVTSTAYTLQPTDPQNIAVVHTSPVKLRLPVSARSQYKFFVSAPYLEILDETGASLGAAGDGSLVTLSRSNTGYAVSVEQRAAELLPMIQVSREIASLSAYAYQGFWNIKPIGNGRLVEWWRTTSSNNSACVEVWARLIDLSGATPQYGTATKLVDTASIYNQPGRTCDIWDGHCIDMAFSDAGTAVLAFSYAYDHTNGSTYSAVARVTMTVSGLELGNISLPAFVGSSGNSTSENNWSTATNGRSHGVQTYVCVSYVKSGGNGYWLLTWADYRSSTNSLLYRVLHGAHYGTVGDAYGRTFSAGYYYQTSGRNVKHQVAGNKVVIAGYAYYSGSWKYFALRAEVSTAGSVSEVELCGNASDQYAMRSVRHENGVIHNIPYWTNSGSLGSYAINEQSYWQLLANGSHYVGNHGLDAPGLLNNGTRSFEMTAVPVSDTQHVYVARGGRDPYETHRIDVTLNASGSVSSRNIRTVPNKNTQLFDYVGQGNNTNPFLHHHGPMMYMTCNGKKLLFCFGLGNSYGNSAFLVKE